jgi:EmrB/QacA subfamily drug resistance transporter
MQYKVAVAAVFVSAMFLDILDTTIVNVALPQMGRDFRSDAVEWVVLSYTLSLAMWIPASGWLGDRFGTKRVFLTALAIFVVGSAMCGAAQSLSQLIAFRFLQGVGGGMLTPVGVAMLFRAWPPAERAKASTIIMVPTLAAPALGPIIGGLLVTNFDWRWIFYINVPLGILAFAFGVATLRENTEPSAGRFDLPGFVFSALGLSLVVFALSEGPRSGWTSPTILTTGAIGLVSFVVLVVVELRAVSPMLDLRLLGERLFRINNIISALSFPSFVGLIFLLPLYLQNVRGLSALDSGLTTFPQAIGVLLTSQIAGRLYPTIGPRRLIAGGLAAAAVLNASFAFLDVDSDLWTIRLLIFARGFCMGFAFVPMQASSYARISSADNGRASSIFSTQRQMALSVGIAVLATVLSTFAPLTGQIDDLARAMTGYRVTFIVCGVFALGAAVAAMFVHDEDAAATMVPRRR